MLRDDCKAAGGQSAWADHYGVSPQYVSNVLNGRREPGLAILEALNLRMTAARYEDRELSRLTDDDLADALAQARVEGNNAKVLDILDVLSRRVECCRSIMNTHTSYVAAGPGRFDNPYDEVTAEEAREAALRNNRLLDIPGVWERVDQRALEKQRELAESDMPF